MNISGISVVKLTLLLLLFSGLAGAEDSGVAVEPELSLDQALQGFDGEVPDDEIEDILGGFDEGEIEVESEPGREAVGESRSPIRGHWLNSLSWNFAHPPPVNGQVDYRGLSKLATKLWLEYEQPLRGGWKFHGDGHLRHDFSYAIHDDNRYSSAVLDRYESEIELGEFWLAGSLNSHLDLKVGRQIVVWGQSDYLRVNDTINPLDLREPGLGEIETLRRPVGMVRADYFLQQWGVTLLAIPENRPHLTPPCGSDFSMAGALNEANCSGAILSEQFPQDGFQQMEWGLSAIGRFSGWDLSLYGARLNHDLPYQRQSQLHYARISQLGAAVNVADGSWLWKGEAAYLDGTEYSDGVDRPRLDLLVGGEYRGFNDVTLSFEVARRQVYRHTPSLIMAPDYTEQSDWQSVLAYQHDFQNNTLHLKGVAIRNGVHLDQGGSTRLSLEYELDDAWSLNGGVIWYQSSQTPPNWGDNDRLYLELREDF